MRVEIVDLARDRPPGNDAAGAGPDAAVAIDVIRAFTTAAWAFDAGAVSITCVADIDDAVDRRARGEVDLCIGEEHGLGIEGFDSDNSPVALPADLGRQRIAQRTSNGTQGLVQLTAPAVFAAGATTASATARAVLGAVDHLEDPLVCLLCTDTKRPEDRACADFIAARLRHQVADASELRDTILRAGDLHLAGWAAEASDHRLAAFRRDVAACADVDRHGFAMRAHTDGAARVLTAERW